MTTLILWVILSWGQLLKNLLVRTLLAKVIVFNIRKKRESRMVSRHKPDILARFSNSCDRIQLRKNPKLKGWLLSPRYDLFILMQFIKCKKLFQCCIIRRTIWFLRIKGWNSVCKECHVLAEESILKYGLWFSWNDIHIPCFLHHLHVSLLGTVSLSWLSRHIGQIIGGIIQQQPVKTCNFLPGNMNILNLKDELLNLLA
jgi:hypothetical protein